MREALISKKHHHPDPARGLAVGGLGGPQDELLESGQEEVFSRTEVELGEIEHQSAAGSGETDTDAKKPPQDDF